MHNDLVAYVMEYQNLKFDQVPLGEVDFLILSQLVYIKLDHVIGSLQNPDHKPCTLWEIEKRGNRDLLFADTRYRRDNEALYDAMLKSRRYQDLRFDYYENQIEETLQMQFAAMTVFVDEHTSIVVYRGTDEYLISWKEDFNLSFWEKVPGQMRAMEYLKEVAAKTSGKLYVCGHSKGGNFAVYASLCVDEEIQKRIEKIYNFDGPGINEELLKEKHYHRISYKVHKIIPQASFVGMLLTSPDTAEEVKVVASNANSIMQHDLHSWVIINGRLKTEEKIYDRTRYLDKQINNWIQGLPKKERKFFVETLFGIANASDLEDLKEVSMDMEGLQKAVRMLQAARDLDEETKAKMHAMLKDLVSAVMNPVRNKLKK